MFVYTKKLQYPVKIEKPNPKLARIIITQYGGPDGELGASPRYLSQRFSMPFDELKGLLTDIGTEASKCIWIGVFPSLGFPKKTDCIFVSNNIEYRRICKCNPLRCCHADCPPVVWMTSAYCGLNPKNLMNLVFGWLLSETDIHKLQKHTK